MKLTASDFDKLSAFYRDDELLSLRPGKRLLAWLEDHFDVRVVNNQVKMDANTKTLVRQLLEQENPSLNLKAGLPRGANRMAMSAVVRDEKLAAIKPQDNYVLVKGYHNDIVLTSGAAPLSKEISLRVPVNQLQPDAYDVLLVVENLDVFDALPEYSLPINGTTLLVYRGHDKGTSKGLKALLTLSKGQCELCWFPDLDPKGLELAFTENAVSKILSVDIEIGISQLHPLNNPQKFLTQSKSVNYLKTSEYAAHPLINCTLKHHLAVMQQHILSHDLKMTLYDKNESAK